METQTQKRGERRSGKGIFWPPPALFTGLLLLTIVENTLLTGEFWRNTEASFQIVGATYALVSAAAILIAALWAKSDERWAHSAKIYDTFAAIFAAACALLLVLPFVRDPFILAAAVVPAALAAAAYGPLVLSWVSLYARLPMGTIIGCFAAAYGLGSIASEALVVIEPRWLVDVLMAAAALGSAAFFRIASRSAASSPALSPDNAPISSSEPFPLRPVIICGVVAFVTTFMQNCGPMADVPLTNFLGALLAVAILSIAMARHKMQLVKLQQVALVLAVASALCLPFAGQSVGTVGMALSMAANLVFLVFEETLLCGIALRYGYNAPWLVGVSLAVMAVASLLAVGGSAMFLSLSLSIADTALVAGILALTVLVLFLQLITESDVMGAWGMEEPSDAAPSEEPNISLRVFELSCRYGFTKREEEVCTLLAQGHNVAGIEEILVVSNSTAKSHVAHIYKKMNIHSIAEFRAVFAGQ